jgi:hypothetical protein
MKKLFYQPFKIAILGASVLVGVSGARGQSFSMQIVADNDFAVFGGTATSINDLIYQNDFSWTDQISGLSTLTFNLAEGDTTFYLLGLGGGGQENISGTVNGQDIAVDATYDPVMDEYNYVFNPLNVQMSSDLGPYLTDWSTASVDGGAVAQGTYDASLSDVQLAFGNLTWGSPDLNNSDGVIGSASPNGYGFHFDPSTAHLFAIDGSALGIAPAPEPSTWVLMAFGLIVLGKKFYSKRGQHQVLV